jgi:predicted enzyme related to lactoylglutathione lyase
MAFAHVHAGSLVTDLTAAEQWYSTLFARGPDTRPMAGLLEWYMPDGSGVQVYQEPERSGHSSVVLMDDDLDGTAARLAEASVAHSGPQPGGGARILMLTDPDGNRVVLTGK